jgi:hypothetical protein
LNFDLSCLLTFLLSAVVLVASEGSSKLDSDLMYSSPFIFFGEILTKRPKWKKKPVMPL